MRKFALLLIPVIALGLGLFFLLSGDPYEELANQQLSLITDAVETVTTFEENGNSEEALSKLASLKNDFANWTANQDRLDEAGDKAPGEILAEIEQRRGELANSMIQLEISEHQKASEVLAALESLVSQP
ncbi:MAG TPA: hypothetical protein VJ960_05190 [Oceanipulchritudo sp.]|nr:hypothetical protein [Oceanipulchritudo sp.]